MDSSDTHIVQDGKAFYKRRKIDTGVGPEHIRCLTIGRRLAGLSDDADLMRIEAALIEQRQMKIYDLECAFIPALCDMEMTGAYIDADTWKRGLAHQAKLAAEAKAQLDQIATYFFPEGPDGLPAINYRSPPQVLELLNYLDVQVPILTEDLKERTAPINSTAKDVLQTAIDAPPVKWLMAYRSAVTLISGYGQSYLERLEAGSGHFTYLFDQLGTATGRISSVKGINMLNMPTAKFFRDAVHGPLGTLVASHDYKQFELRIWAELSGDPYLREAFGRGVDIHSFIGQKIFKTEVSKEKTPELRAAVKELAFGIIYGMTRRTFYMRLLALGMKIPYLSACEIYNGFESEFRVGISFLRDMGQRALRTGVLWTPLGRRRTWDKTDARGARKRAIEREGMNYLMQGTGGEIMKIAMIKTRRAMIDGGFKSLFFNQVYDELNTFSPVDESDSFCRVKEKAMIEAGNAIMKTVPLEVECRVGPTWALDRSYNTGKT